LREREIKEEIMKAVGILVVLLFLPGCYGDESLGEGKDTSVVSSPEVQGELMDRWNRVVDSGPAVMYDFHWRRFDQFPHPTYQGEGEPLGYQIFADILLTFLDDNFDYLAGHHLFDAALTYDLPSDPRSDAWSFRGLVDDLLDNWYDPGAERLGALGDMAARIDAAN
jgi:hypothetical protein